MRQEPLLPGINDNQFESALERYGIWPTTVWDVDYSDAVTQRLKRLIGDLSDIDGATRTSVGGAAGGLIGMTRKNKNKAQRLSYRPPSRVNVGSKQAHGTSESNVYGKVGTDVHVSVFNPAIAAWALNCFAPQPPAVCYDPFAGGGTRAVMAAKYGMRYEGCEVRREEVLAVSERLDANGVTVDQATIHHADARDAASVIAAESADYLLTCPPYWNLEQYDGGEADLSMAPDYATFLRDLERVILSAHTILKPGALACWVVGIFRNDDGTLLPFHHDVVRLHSRCGYRLKEEVVLAHRNNGAIQRVGNFDKGNRYLIRTHEYMLVFVRT